MCSVDISKEIMEGKGREGTGCDMGEFNDIDYLSRYLASHQE